MNCKSLYCGPTDLKSLQKVSKKVLNALAACLFDNLHYLSIRDKIVLLNPGPYDVAFVCDKYGIDEVEVIEQYPSSLFYEPYKCNFRVRLYSSKIYSVYSCIR